MAGYLNFLKKKKPEGAYKCAFGFETDRKGAPPNGCAP